MIAYIKGLVTNISLNSIIIENNGIGYEVFFSRPEKVSLNQEILIYTYQKVAEDELSLYGFLSREDLTFFSKLLSVKGIGAKSAINILSKTNLNSLVNAIESGDQNYLKTINGIGAKSAGQIVLDLKGKLDFVSENTNNLVFENLSESLRYLGYKTNEIQAITKQLSDYQNEKEEFILKKALQLLAARRG